MSAPVPYVCVPCGQRILDGKPCGCGARPAIPWYARPAPPVRTHWRLS